MAEPDLDKLNFYSGVNYMKRSDKSGSGPVNATDVDIDHNLTYVPQYVYYVDLDNNGFLWYGGERVHAYTESTAGGGPAVPWVDAWITENTLTLNPNSLGGSRTAKWLIYLDYGA